MEMLAPRLEGDFGAIAIGVVGQAVLLGVHLERIGSSNLGQSRGLVGYSRTRAQVGLTGKGLEGRRGAGASPRAASPGNDGADGAGDVFFVKLA